jgi:hypothetical protein
MWERRSYVSEMEDKDPLARLYQIEDVDSSALEEEALVWVVVSWRTSRSSASLGCR